MTPDRHSSSLRRGLLAAGAVVSLAMVPTTALMLTVGGSPSAAAATSVDLGTAGTFGVLAATTVTNTGPSVITGDLGVSPGDAVTGFPPGTVLGTIHAADDVALQAQADLITAYDAVAAQASDETISADLAGRTLTTGVYTSASTMGLSGELTLDAQGDPNAVFVFQVGSGLTTASGSDITLTNGAQACNVFWQVGSSAELGTGSTFVGSILALTSISALNGATVDGRLLARNGAVTLDTNSVTVSTCATGGPTTGGPTTGGPTTGGPTTGGPTTDGPTNPVPSNPVPSNPVPSNPVPSNPVPTNPVPTNPVPREFPDTGDGGSMNGSNDALIGAGSLALLLAAGLCIWWCRETLTE